MLPYLVRPAAQPAPLPRRRRQAGLLAQGSARATRRTGSPRWHYDDAGTGETEWYFVADSPPRSPGWRTTARVELHPWTSTRRRRPHEPTWALIDIDPGPKTHLRRRARAGPPVPHRARPPRRRGGPKVTGQRGIQIWVPIAPGLHVRRHPGVGRDALAGGRRRPCPSSSAGRGRRRTGTAWPGSTTRRTRSTRRSSRRSALRPAPGAPVSVPIDVGRARRPRPRARPLDDPHRPRPPRPRPATRSPTSSASSRSCPPSERCAGASRSSTIVTPGSAEPERVASGASARAQIEHSDFWHGDCTNLHRSGRTGYREVTE